MVFLSKVKIPGDTLEVPKCLHKQETMKYNKGTNNTLETFVMNTDRIKEIIFKQQQS